MPRCRFNTCMWWYSMVRMRPWRARCVRTPCGSLSDLELVGLPDQPHDLAQIGSPVEIELAGVA